MDIFQVECVAAIAECGSFTKAAFDLCISQSALSKQVAKLEAELHVRLFDRTKKSVALTPAGEAFLPAAKQMLEDHEKLCSVVKQYADGGTLRLGSIDHLGRVGLAGPIASFISRYPAGQVQIDLRKGDTRSLLGLLLSGKIDMAIVAEICSPATGENNLSGFDLASCRRITLLEDDYCAVMSTGHPLAKQEMVSWKEISGEKLMLLDKSYSVNSIIRNSFAAQGLNPNIVFECGQVDTLLGMCEEGYGVAMLSRKVADSRYRVTACSLREYPVSRNTVLVVPKACLKGNKLGGEFARHIVEQCALERR